MRKTAILVLDNNLNLLLNILYRVHHFELSGLVKVSVFSKRHSKSDASLRRKLCLFCWEKLMKLITNTEEAIDLLATKIAELKLSELGYHFIPGIAPYFTRARRILEAKALIVNNDRSLIDEGNRRETS